MLSCVGSDLGDGIGIANLPSPERPGTVRIA